ncbi:DUF833 domain-containing protein [Drechmeria coniospora]|uniref:DUF833 domain-containing protein n=1 Tax=Drechmeria coniospora TaxID=98403 RepID=A0A151GT07_DRECN|nr:DUF833 domain-containing protein [Drechmeria coniospora]KYK60256.1 DUF833 domain-containing protein [Drechmeria coniospora]ODA80200.1 hypothetical protein RJ55_03158 [Drechmeria coniospora]
MCIVLFTTAHPDYALIVIDNRDEFILRPTSRPSWWTHPTSGRQVLAARDLQRTEKGTWFGITRTGLLAVLTNYREANVHDAAHPIHGVKSRGGMVNAWLGGLANESVQAGVHQLVVDAGVQGVGGFSMLGAKLRRKGGAIAVVSNRAKHPDDVPLVARNRNETWGLSNTVFDDPHVWPKVENGKRLLDQVVTDAVKKQSGQDDLVRDLFSLLDTDTLPEQRGDRGVEHQIRHLKHTIFVPLIGDEKHEKAMQEAVAKGRVDWTDMNGDTRAVEELMAEQRPEGRASLESAAAFETGMYGTQRQTVLLVDLEGNVTFVERALWDGNGNKIPQGDGDVVFRFKIDGWDDE